MNYWMIDNYENIFQYILKINEKDLQKYLTEEQKNEYYKHCFKLPKKNGFRTIYSPDKKHELYRLQRNLLSNFLKNIQLADPCCGFRIGYSYFDFLSPHKAFYDGKVYLRLDIKSFFDSITRDSVEKTLKYYFSESDELTKEEIFKAVEYCTEILTFNDQIIQGAPTSPLISNIVFRRYDKRIENYCNKLGITYTRYADDLLFSSYNRLLHSKRFTRMISVILKTAGLSINYSKTIRSINEISVNGFVVCNEILISRSKRKQFNSVMYMIEKIKWSKLSENINQLNEELSNQGLELHFSGKYQLINYLTGYRAFLIQVFNGLSIERNKTKYSNLISRIERMVQIIDDLRMEKLD